MSAPDPQTEESRALVVRVWQARGSRNEEEIAALFHDDVVWSAPEQNATAIALDYPTVVVEERMTATLPDGRTYANDFVFVFTCRDGRGADIREHMDTAAGHRQLFPAT